MLMLISLHLKREESAQLSFSDELRVKLKVNTLGTAPLILTTHTHAAFVRGIPA